MVSRRAVSRSWPRGEITVEYEEGSSVEVRQHDGSVLRLRKAASDYDPTDRIAAMRHLQEKQAAGEIATGLLYIDEDPVDLHEALKTVDAPLNSLGDADLCPGQAELDRRRRAFEGGAGSVVSGKQPGGCRRRIRRCRCKIDRTDQTFEFVLRNQTRPEEHWSFAAKIDHGRFQSAGARPGVEDQRRPIAETSDDVLGRSRAQFAGAIGTRCCQWASRTDEGQGHGMIRAAEKQPFSQGGIRQAPHLPRQIFP